MAKKHVTLKNYPAKYIRNTLLGSDNNYHIQRPTFKFEHLTVSGDFSLDLCEHSTLHTMLQAFKSIETMTWQNILQATHDKGKSRSHPIETNALTNKGYLAYKKKYPKVEQQPELFSLAICNKLRVIGYRDGSSFYVIWIDPNHNFVATKYSS